MRGAFAIATIVTAALLGFVSTAAGQTSEESLKATFLYRFTSFVTWPDSAFASPEAPVVLCVSGSAPFAATLENAVANQRADSRLFEVRRLQDSASALRCHAVYITGDRVDDTLRAVRGSPVLTITDGAIGGSSRGIIHFVLISDRVRFHVDDALAAEGRLFISSRLLSLAVSVRQRAEP